MKVRFKQRWGFVGVVTMLSLVLAACGGGGNTGTTTSPAGSAAGSTGASASAGGTTASASAGGASASASSSGTMASSSASSSGSGSMTSPSASASTGGGGAGTTATSGAGETATTGAGETATTGADETATTGAGVGGGQAAACPASAQGAQITMWSPLTGPDGNQMTALAQQFSQNNPQNIKVNHVAQPDYIQKLNTAAAGKNLPEMTVIREGDVPLMAARNIIRPMNNDVLSIVGVSGSDFPQDAWNAVQYKNQLYAIPLDVHPLVLYYNKDMFQKAGITMPTDRPMNKQEFEAAADKLNTNGVMGIAIGTLFSAETLFDTLVHQFGGTLTNQDGTQATYNSDQGVQALTYEKQLKQKYSPSIAGQGDPEVTAFQQGKAAMVIHGPWHISNLEKLPFTGFAMVPQLGDNYAVQGGTHNLALTTDDPAKQAAAGCWIAWLSQNSVQWAKAGQIPARNSARESGDLASVAPPVAAFAKEASAVTLLPPVPGIGTAIGGAQGFGAAVNPVVQGQQQDVKAALDAAAQKSNQLLQQNAQQYGQ